MDGEKIVAGIFGLVLLYLILANSTALNNIVNQLAIQGEANIKALQGRG